jgi:predicted amidophosphoribosyltransferase
VAARERGLGECPECGAALRLRPTLCPLCGRAVTEAARAQPSSEVSDVEAYHDRVRSLREQLAALREGAEAV